MYQCDASLLERNLREFHQSQDFFIVMTFFSSLLFLLFALSFRHFWRWFLDRRHLCVRNCGKGPFLFDGSNNLLLFQARREVFRRYKLGHALIRHTLFVLGKSFFRSNYVRDANLLVFFLSLPLFLFLWLDLGFMFSTSCGVVHNETPN